MALFNWIGSLFGYLLWFFYQIFRNYGVAIIFFTLVTKLLMTPFSIKQQKSMAAQQKMMAKQRLLQEKYANDREKMNRELQKLYEKENFNPMGGCAMSLLPFPIMIGIYYSVISPLRNTLHIAASSIQNAAAVFAKIPGVSISGSYMELEILRHFTDLKDYFVTNNIFTGAEISRIESFNTGFRFFGLDLLATPHGSPLSSMLWLIPVLCLLSYWGMQWLTNKMTGTQNQQGCMKVMFFVLPLFSAYWAYMMPAAVGLYWVVSSLLQMVQTYVLHKMYSPVKVTAQAEAAHIARMELDEEKVRPLPQEVQDKIAEKLLPRKFENDEKPEKHDAAGAAEKTAGSKKKKSAGKGGNSSDYMGTKK